jgi:hypothetical protein
MGKEGNQFLVIIIIIKLILLKIRVRIIKFQKYTNDSASLTVTRFIIFMKRTTDSDTFASYIYKTRSDSPYHLCGVWTKHAIASGAFHYFSETRH